MDITKSEKIVMLMLSVVMLLGSVQLYRRNSRPFVNIQINKREIKQQYSLVEIEERIRERKKININSASVEELCSIPGLGKVIAARIVEYRQVNGRFYSSKDLLNVDGIGSGKLKKMSEYLKFE